MEVWQPRSYRNIHSDRQEGWRWAARAQRTHSKAMAGGPEWARWQLVDRQSHICIWITEKNKWGATQSTQPRALAQGNKASNPLTEKTCEGCVSGRNSQFHRRVCWRDPQSPRMYTKPPTQESAPEGPN